MTDTMPLAAFLPMYGLFFVFGTILGLAFLWGLWLTVQRLGHARHPGLLMMGSLSLRLGITLTAFYLIAQHGDWRLLLTAVAGFTLARLLVAHRIRPPGVSEGHRP